MELLLYNERREDLDVAQREEDYGKHTEGRVPPASRVNSHLRRGAEALPSSPILQHQPTYKVITADMETTFFSSSPSCQRQPCFCLGRPTKPPQTRTTDKRCPC